MEYELLSEITSGSIINSIHDAYPDYLRLILQGRQDEISLKKIKGVKEYRHNLYCRLINEKFKYYHILESNKQYKLELKDCKALANIYSTVEKINEMMQENPYYCLIYICSRDFLNADKIIIECRPDLVNSDIRTEFAMIYLLKLNEQEGHTYIDAKEIGNKMLPFGLEVVRKLKDVAVDSELIYYNEVENTLALTNTYLAECRIVEFVKDKLNNSTKLEDWDWHKFTKIKDGELTDEQSYVLKNFCENNITILNAIGGCVDKDTEFFNGNEWKKISEWNENDKVLQYNKDGSAKLVTPSRYIKKPCEWFWHFETKYGLSQTLSDDHNVVYKDKFGEIKTITMKELVAKHNNFYNVEQFEIITNFSNANKYNIISKQDSIILDKQDRKSVV